MNYEPFYFWKVEVVDEGEHTTLQCMVEAHDDNTYSWRILNMTTGGDNDARRIRRRISRQGSLH